jgi:hypothetical protein
MYTKQVNNEIKDVFLGTTGWSNWLRYQLTEGKWRRIAGMRVDTETHRKIVERLDKQYGRNGNG